MAGIPSETASCWTPRKPLGPPADRKAHVTFEGGHIPLRVHDVIRTILDWFDKYLGLVEA